MRSFIRKLAMPFALLFSVALFTGCYSENNLWAARKGELTLPTGSYIYFLSSAAGSARTKISSEQEVLKSEIDGEKAETWIRKTAEKSVQSFFYVNEKFDEMKLSLDEKDVTDMNAYADSMWSYYSTSMEAQGISKDSFNLVYNDFSLKQSLIFKALYGQDGEKAVSDKDLSDYYADNYYAYEYFTVTVPEIEKEDSADSSSETATTEIDEEAKEKIQKQLEDYKKQIEGGKLTMSEAADDYKDKNALENSTYNNYEGKKDGVYGTVAETMLDLDENKLTIVESTTSTLVLARRIAIADKTEEMLTTEASKNSILSDMKWAEFADYIEEEAAKLSDIEWNNSVIGAQKISSFFPSDSKNGTSSAESSVSSES